MDKPGRSGKGGGRRGHWTRLRRLVVGAVLVGAPWVWYLVRDASPYLDMVALTLPAFVLVGLVIAVAAAWRTRRLVPIAATVSLTLFAVVAIQLPRSRVDGTPPSRPVLVVAGNVKENRDTPDAATAARLLAEDADVLVVTELSPEVHDALDDYEYRAATERAFSRRLGPHVGVYSRWPVDVLPAPDDLPGLRVEVEHPTDPFVLYAVHVPKPTLTPEDYGYLATFPEHRELVDMVGRSADAEALPVVIAGDLNSSDRGGDYRELAGRFDDAVRTGDAGTTSVKGDLGWPLLLLRIDHIFVSRDWCADEGDRVRVPGTDHQAVEAEVGPCP